LKTYFGDIRIDHLSRVMANDFRTYLAKRKINRKPISEQTVRKHLRNCKAIFTSAVNEDLMLFNPFDRLKSAPQQPDKNWYYLTREDFEQLLSICPNLSWQVFLGLCRLGGLRQNEAYELTWCQIDWSLHRISVLASKTGKKRMVPIEPRLYELLLTAYEAAPDGIEQICYEVRKNNLRRTFYNICRRVEMEPWEKWCHTLRKNAETDWSQRFPQYIVSYWLGHSITVSEKHYLQVPEELYEKVAHSTPVQQPRKLVT
jgi:integrase